MSSVASSAPKPNKHAIYILNARIRLIVNGRLALSRNSEAEITMRARSSIYCPFDVISDASRLGLERAQFYDPTFGRIAYWTREDAGSTLGEGTLFLHGVGGTWSSWTPLLQQADRGHVPLGTVVFVDLPGFGSSQNLSLNLDTFEVGELLLRLTEHLGLSRIHLVGQSMGGYLALMMASQNKGRVLTTTVFSGTLFHLSKVSRSRAAAVEVLLKGRRRKVTYEIVKAVGYLVRTIAWLGVVTGVLRIALKNVAAYPARVPRSLLQAIARGIRPECYLLALRNSQLYESVEHWKNIDVNTVAAFGEQDRRGGGPHEAETLRRECPNVATTVLPECGHYIPLEQPGAALEIITAQLGLTHRETMREGVAPSTPLPGEISTNFSEVGAKEVYRTWRDDFKRHKEAIFYWIKRTPLILAPLWVPLATLVATRGWEAVQQRSCGTFTIVQLIGSTPTKTASPCRSAVFAADLPSLALAGGCIALFILHFSWQITFRNLYAGLRHGRLLQDQYVEIAESAKETVRMRAKYLYWLPIFTLIVVFFYWLSYDRQNLVQDFIKHQVTIVNGMEEHPAIDRRTWWADYHGRNIVNAATWCAIGITTFSIGMFDQFRLRRITVWFKQNAHYLTRDYQPIYRTDQLNDDPFGLNCVYALIELKRWGGIVLCASSAAIFYLIRTSDRILFDFFALFVVSVLLLIWYIPLHQLRTFVERHLQVAVECARLRYAQNLEDPLQSFEQTLRDRFELEQILILASAGNRSIVGSWTQRAVLAVTVLAALGGLYPVLIGTW